MARFFFAQRGTDDGINEQTFFAENGENYSESGNFGALDADFLRDQIQVLTIGKRFAKSKEEIDFLKENIEVLKIGLRMAA